ncbi:MAG: acetyl/propionyl-CoA carboxylase subuit alpha [Betaproteobacteria bacterium]
MFKKILIANRGEIAVRIARTARRMGVRTVAVYSEADSGARHVRVADEAAMIGPAPARDSYLSIERIMAVAARTGAEAIHPGYGFLSENEALARACAAEGIVFIGPPAAAIAAMGSKATAKLLVEATGVPLVPGYHGDNQDPAFLLARAAAIGYPIIIKPVAGGGGKGMRVVSRSDEFEPSLQACRREASASFGDDRVLIEKFLLRPRHVEVQIFADRHGRCVHLFERDCSVQRRHQKVVEEAPAPGLSPELRATMGEAAVAIARRVDYEGAGTVEFILDQAGQYYFMEMNTRLQVEHPVTEMITGLDLVEWQLRVAAGEPLPLAQEQLSTQGHAIEVRVYAEDPARGFVPSTGMLEHFTPPAENVHVRVDSGVDQGDTISPHYDPMIAKLIVWDEDRQRAMTRLLQALADCRIVGVANNVEFLSRLVACPAFASADLDTALIEREHDYLLASHTDAPPLVCLVAALADLMHESAASSRHVLPLQDACSPWLRRDGWRMNARARRSLRYRLGETERTLMVSYQVDAYRLELDGVSYEAHVEHAPDGGLYVEIDGMRCHAHVMMSGERRQVFLHGQSHALTAVDPLRPAEGAGQHEGGLSAPMPGKIIQLLVAPGAHVQPNTPLLTLEAMKMEHTITAPAAGVLHAFRFQVGEQVGEGEELVEFAKDES